MISRLVAFGAFILWLWLWSSLGVPRWAFITALIINPLAVWVLVKLYRSGQMDILYYSCKVVFSDIKERRRDKKKTKLKEVSS